MQQELSGAADWNGGVALADGVRPGTELEACWTARESLLSEATVLLEAGDQHEHRVGEILLGALETITHAEAR